MDIRPYLCNSSYFLHLYVKIKRNITILHTYARHISRVTSHWFVGTQAVSTGLFFVWFLSHVRFFPGYGVGHLRLHVLYFRLNYIKQ